MFIKRILYLRMGLDLNVEFGVALVFFFTSLEVLSFMSQKNYDFKYIIEIRTSLLKKSYLKPTLMQIILTYKK